MNPKLDRKIFVSCLISLVIVAIDRDLSDDAAGVLAGVHVLRPRLLELDLLDAQVAMSRGQFHEAIHLLRNVESSPTQWSMAKAFLARCQHRLGDPEWRLSVGHVLQSGVALPEAIELAAALEKGRDESGNEAAGDSSGGVLEMNSFAAYNPGMEYGFMHLRA